MIETTPIKLESTRSDISEDTFIISLDELSISSLPRRVSFGNINVRKFDRIVGDHPWCKTGAPLSIGWEFQEIESIPIERYESERVLKGKKRLSSITRKIILHNVYGFSLAEISAAEKQVQRVTGQRKQSELDANVEIKTGKKASLKSFVHTMIKVLPSMSSTKSTI